MLPARGDEGHSWHMYQVLVDFEAHGMTRVTFQKRMAEHGIGVGHHYPSLPSLSFYRTHGFSEFGLPVAARVVARSSRCRCFQRCKMTMSPEWCMPFARSSDHSHRLAAPRRKAQTLGRIQLWLGVFMMKCLSIIALSGALLSALCMLHSLLARWHPISRRRPRWPKAFHVFAGQCVEERAGGSVFLSGGLHAGLHGRGPQFCGSHRQVQGARRHGNRREP